MDRGLTAECGARANAICKSKTKKKKVWKKEHRAENVEFVSHFHIASESLVGFTRRTERQYDSFYFVRVYPFRRLCAVVLIGRVQSTCIYVYDSLVDSRLLDDAGKSHAPI